MHLGQRSWARQLATLAVLTVAAGVSGCGGFDGVELNGGVFDYLGVSSKSQTAGVPKLPERAGIVMPPQPDRLPEPGSGVAAEPGQQFWPSDPDERKKTAKSDLEKRHQAFCDKAKQEAKARGDELPIIGPNGKCTNSIFDTVTTNVVPQDQPARASGVR